MLRRVLQKRSETLIEFRDCTGGPRCDAGAPQSGQVDGDETPDVSIS
jgi:hypothetical protein